MESVWDYPRPPVLRRCSRPVRIVFAGRTVAETAAAWCVLETSHPPNYYLPADAFVDCEIKAAPGSSLCEWKGTASYWTIRANGRVARRAAWSYPEPATGFEPIRDHLAVYAAAMDSCWVGEDRVEPQPGGFYGGWITPELQGPFKGGPGTMGW